MARRVDVGLRVSGAVNRSAWVISPAATSSQRTSPGRIGSPAASADVQPAGRSSFERGPRSRPSRHATRRRAAGANSSYRLQASVSTMSMWRVRAVLDQRRGRDRVRAGVGLVVVVERHRPHGRRRVDHLVRDPVARVRPEVHVERPVRADGRDHRRAVAGDARPSTRTFQTLSAGNTVHRRARITGASTTSTCSSPSSVPSSSESASFGRGRG